MNTMKQEGNALVYRWDAEALRIEPWGENSLRVRAVVLGEVEDTDFALLPLDGTTQKRSEERRVGKECDVFV